MRSLWSSASSASSVIHVWAKAEVAKARLALVEQEAKAKIEKEDREAEYQKVKADRVHHPEKVRRDTELEALALRREAAAAEAEAAVWEAADAMRNGLIKWNE